MLAGIAMMIPANLGQNMVYIYIYIYKELQNIMDFVLWSNPDAKGAGIDLDSVK